MEKKVALVIGGGAFGTSMANVLGNSFERVLVQVRSDDVFEGILQGENKVYLPGKKLNKELKPFKAWKDVESDIKDISLVVMGLPTSALRPYLGDENNLNYIKEILENDVPMVSLCKGIEATSLELPDDLLYQFLGEYKDNLTFLSGPSFAAEIMDEQITLASLAGRSKKHLSQVAEFLSCHYFKVFMTYDVKGVLLGGALKNILPLLVGLLKGWVITTIPGQRLSQEASQKCYALVKYLTQGRNILWLGGMGDLILTTTGGLSRNKSFGLEMAKGRKAKEIISSQRSVVEGYKTTYAAHLLSQKYEIHARIFRGIYEVLYNDADVREIIQNFMELPAKFEID